MSGCEWVVDARGCDPASLRDLGRLRSLLERMVEDLPLHPVGAPMWHQFPGEGGVTGLCLLSESHFACHTFPEYGSLCINLFCCRQRENWDFAGYLIREFGARDVEVRRLDRDYAGVLVPLGKDASAA
ncbi:MAG TPA: S-adenosylmethionine decarboxylase [Bryobacteraceae bacterium]|jgi:S-adenosylmethionine decarboxylase|nr:S-adenosylmethionine decarboxylase [Bryobacteraceae bacterium]